MSYVSNNGVNDCGCGGQLRDDAGVNTLRTLYNNKGDSGGLTLVEKVTHNPIALGVGFCVGVSAGYFLLPKGKTKKR